MLVVLAANLPENFVVRRRTSITRWSPSSPRCGLLGGTVGPSWPRLPLRSPPTSRLRARGVIQQVADRTKLTLQRALDGVA
jgi:hypothetical protein